MATETRGDRRIELHQPLDDDEVVPVLVAASGGRMVNFVQRSRQGVHYSPKIWRGTVLPSTGFGHGQHVDVGITDYEYFGGGAVKRPSGSRTRDHRHFYVSGHTSACDHVIDVFCNNIHAWLWDQTTGGMDVRRGWPRLNPETRVMNMTLATDLELHRRRRGIPDVGVHPDDVVEVHPDDVVDVTNVLNQLVDRNNGTQGCELSLGMD